MTMSEKKCWKCFCLTRWSNKEIVASKKCLDKLVHFSICIFKILCYDVWDTTMLISLIHRCVDSLRLKLLCLKFKFSKKNLISTIKYFLKFKIKQFSSELTKSIHMCVCVFMQKKHGGLQQEFGQADNTNTGALCRRVRVEKLHIHRALLGYCRRLHCSLQLLSTMPIAIPHTRTGCSHRPQSSHHFVPVLSGWFADLPWPRLLVLCQTLP